MPDEPRKAKIVGSVPGLLPAPAPADDEAHAPGM
jgi:hypothetical protein